MQKKNKGVPEFSNIFHEKPNLLELRQIAKQKKSIAMKAGKRTHE